MKLSGLRNLLTENSFKRVEKLDSKHKLFALSSCGYVIKKISENNYSVRCINL